MKNEKLPRVWNFSGGRTSAYMVIHGYQPGDIVLFTDTGREHPKTYKFINDFEAFEGIPVTRIRFKNAKNPYRALLESYRYTLIPNKFKKKCTEELKQRTAKRFLKSAGILTFINFIGFRADEQERILKRKKKFKKVIDKFPLADAGVTNPMILDYWRRKPYDLEIPAILGNCTLCFLKGKNAIIAILREFPELGNEWIEDEELSRQAGANRTYFPDVTIKQLRDIAQNTLFKDYKLEDITPAYNCACSPT